MKPRGCGATHHFAVLGDTDPNWRPNRFRYGGWGCEVSMTFPVVKLLDFRPRMDKLEQSDNPFAAVIMAHLRAQETSRKPRQRLAWKLRLTKSLYDKGYAEQQIRELYRFIDWVMRLPEGLDQQFLDEMERFEEERAMPYVTSAERIGEKRGRQEGACQEAREAVLDIVGARFNQRPELIAGALEQISDLDRLKALRRRALVAESFEEFERELG